MNNNVKHQMLIELRSKNFNPPDIIADGQIKRFDRDGHKNAWYVAYENKTKNGKPFGMVIYSDWKEQCVHKFKTSNDYSAIEQAEISRSLIVKAEEAKAKVKQDKIKALKEANQLWSEGKSHGQHQYLANKKIDSLLGAKTYKDKMDRSVLLVPMRNVFGDLKGLQKIYDNGEKRFITGQENKGNFIVIPDCHDLKGKQEVYVVEGFATGGSIHMATNKPVVCALNAGNLEDVCWNLKAFNSQLTITIAGDDDKKLPGNPGKTKAKEAAQETGSALIFPKFDPLDSKSTDFNDVHVLHGLDTLREQLRHVEHAKTELPAYTKLASQYLKKNQKNKLVAWRSEIFKFNGKCYDKLIQSDLINDVIKFLQKHPIAWIKAGKHLSSEVLVNLEAKINIVSKISYPFWMSDPDKEVKDIICLENGLIDLNGISKYEEISITPHSSDLFQTNCLAYSFDSKAKCPKWLSFLDLMVPDKETQRSLQEWFGYNLVADVSFEKFAVFYGQGANGKSVCCMVLRALIGDRNASAVNLEAFDPKRTFNLAATVGKLSNIVEELNVSSKTEEGELKKFVSGGLMTVERKRKDPFEVLPTARLTFATNTLPKLSDSSDGLWRRLLLFPFNIQILDEAKQDRKLRDKDFWLESGELPGVFNWAIEGLLRLKSQKKFTVSKEMIQAAEQFKIESNPTKEFLLNHCVEFVGKTVKSVQLYDLYKRHMQDSGYITLGRNRFHHEIKLVFPKAKKSHEAVLIGGRREYLWHNLDLQQDIGI